LYPVTDYTRYTQQYFEEIAYSTTNTALEDTIASLVFSIRYVDLEPIDYTILRQDFINAYNITNGFQQDPNEVLYQISETTSSPEPENQDDTSSETSEEDLHNFHIPLPPVYDTPNNPAPLVPFVNNMAQPNQQDFQQLRAAIAALTQALPNTNNALTGNTQAINNPPRREGRVAELPHFYGGNQDPIAWLEEFTRACNANGIANNRKLEVVPAYLKGAASTWWNANQALPNGNANRITAWTGNNNNTDFIQNFPTAFRTQTLVEIWTTELEQRRQQPGEDVDTYAAALQELYRRVETNAFVYPGAIKARKFVNGLLPDLYVTVKPHNDQTWNDAVNRAKSYELTHKDQHAVNAYLNKFASTGASTQSDNLLKAIQDLTKQVQSLGTGNRNNRSYNNNDGFRGNNQSSTNRQNRIVCYSCGQPGHIVRFCPNGNNNNNGTSSVNNRQATANNNGIINGNNTNTPQSTNNDGQQLAQIQQLLAQLLPQDNNDQSLN